MRVYPERILVYPERVRGYPEHVLVYSEHVRGYPERVLVYPALVLVLSEHILVYSERVRIYPEGMSGQSGCFEVSFFSSTVYPDGTQDHPSNSGRRPGRTGPKIGQVLGFIFKLVGGGLATLVV